MRLVVESRLGPQINAYLTLKQALGRRFTNETAVLVHLGRFLVERRRCTLTAKVFAAWSLSLAHLTPTVRRNRMRIVRNFCLYLRRTRPDCFVPDPSTFPARHPARRPHIFGEEQIAELLRIATRLPSVSTSLMRAAVFRIAIVLLYTAGLRRGELARLVLSDYDPIEKTLLVRKSKFHKSRLVALSSSAVDEMARYLRARQRLPHSTDAPLLVSNHGGLRAYTPEDLADGIRGLFRVAGVRTSDGRFPRVHDIRHTYAIHTLLRWYRAGVDVQAKLPALATAMGHVSIASTAYYLALLEPVAEAASARFARHCRQIFGASGVRR